MFSLVYVSLFLISILGILSCLLSIKTFKNLYFLNVCLFAIINYIVLFSFNRIKGLVFLHNRGYQNQEVLPQLPKRLSS